MHKAAVGGALQCTKLLINRGAIIDSRNFQGRTPLYLAQNHKNDEVTEYLEGLTNNTNNNDTNINNNNNNNNTNNTNADNDDNNNKENTDPEPNSHQTPHRSPSNKTTNIESSPPSTPKSRTKRALADVKSEVKKESSSQSNTKRTRVDDEVSFRIGSPDSPLHSITTPKKEHPPPSSLSTTTTTSTSIIRMPPPSTPSRFKNEDVKIVKVKRKDDELFRQVRAPLDCTFNKFVDLIKAKIGMMISPLFLSFLPFTLLNH